MHIENGRDGYLWSTKDKQSYCWIIILNFPCLFLLHEIKWHLLYLIDWKKHAFTAKEVEGTITAEAALMCTYKLIFINKPQRNQGVGIIYREGRANADGKIPFPNSLDPSLSVFKRHFWWNNKRLSQNSAGYLSWIKNWFQHSFILMYC